MKLRLAKSIRYLIGIDEAGRGPLAGPVAVGVTCCKLADLPKLQRLWRGVKDTKQLTPRNREIWFKRLKDFRHQKLLDFKVSLVGEAIIDRWGISRAVRVGIKRCLERLAIKPDQVLILLDGSLRAPRAYQYQKTIIRGDETEPIISLASIVAKVTRDRRLIRLHAEYPQYAFDIHKGYGTALHYQRLRQHGPSPRHRRSFLKKILGKKGK